jgi:hypothetical protein
MFYQDYLISYSTYPAICFYLSFLVFIKESNVSYQILTPVNVIQHCAVFELLGFSYACNLFS